MYWLKIMLLYPVIFYLVNRFSQKVAESFRLPNFFLLPLVLILLPGIIVGLSMHLFIKGLVVYTKLKKRMAL